MNGNLKPLFLPVLGVVDAPDTQRCPAYLYGSLSVVLSLRANA